MARFVFIFGAGASREAGAPLMNTFLDEAESLWNKGDVDGEKESFDLVFEHGLPALQRTSTKARIDLDNLEHVFAAFEMAQLLQRCGDLEQHQIDTLPAAFRTVIEVTLALKTGFPVTKDGKPQQSRAYTNLANHIADVTRQHDTSSIALITFNYDVRLDFALEESGCSPDYCLPKTSRAGLKLLKLHGSLNWARCPDCQNILTERVSGRVHSIAGNRANRAQHMKTFANYRLKGESLSHTGHQPAAGPLLVPPTWNKGAHHAQIASVWQAAAHELSSAEHILVVGYSLPDSDHFFRYLYALGTVGNSRFKAFSIYDPNAAQLEPRYRELLGQSVANKLKVHGMAFEHGLAQIVKEFEDAMSRW